MKRRLPALVAVFVIAAACAPTPPERAPLPRVDQILDSPEQCTFLVGDPQGVLVDEVIPDSAADGLLAAGDVILAIDGAPTDTSADLLAALESTSPGQAIEVEYSRDGTDQTTMLTPGANPDDTSRPMVGVMIRTAYDSVLAAEVGDSIEPGPSTRPITIGGVVYLVDPLSQSWARTGVEIEDELLWISTASGIYSIEGTTLTELVSGEDIEVDESDGWEALRIIGSIGDDLLLAVTRPVATEAEAVAVGVSRFDPIGQRTIWVTPAPSGFGIPVSAQGSPEGKTMVVVGVNEDGSEITGIAIWGADGAALVDDDLTGLGAPLGWLDDDVLLFRSTENVAIGFDITSGDQAQVALDPQVAALPLFPVGDGRNVLAVEGRTLVLEDIETSGEVRMLAQDCNITRVGDPGWQG
ncbi:MAG: PDZ domain-containing protein [Acidimicrobiia bacterium]